MASQLETIIMGCLSVVAILFVIALLETVGLFHIASSFAPDDFYHKSSKYIASLAKFETKKGELTSVVEKPVIYK